MVCGYSRWSSAVLVPTRHAEDLYAGWWQHLRALGAVPLVLIWDGEGAVGRWRARRTEPTLGCQAFRGVLGAKVIVCKPGDPEAKGLVERFHDHLERSFLLGRSFTGPDDFNAQLGGFLARANTRKMRVLGCRPSDRIATDTAAMLTLPSVAPQTGWRATIRLPRDHYIRLDANDYPIHPSVIGRRIEIHADLTRVWATCEGGQRVPTTPGSGPDTRPSPTPGTWRPRSYCAADASTWSTQLHPAASTRCRSGTCRPTTPCSASIRSKQRPSKGASTDGRDEDELAGRARRVQQAGLPHPRVEGTHPARDHHPVGRTRSCGVLDPRGVPRRLAATRGVGP